MLEYILECLSLLTVLAILYYLFKKGHARIVLQKRTGLDISKQRKASAVPTGIFPG